MSCGVDLHSNNSVVVVTDETDKVTTRRLAPKYGACRLRGLRFPENAELAQDVGDLPVLDP